MMLIIICILIIGAIALVGWAVAQPRTYNTPRLKLPDEEIKQAQKVKARSYFSLIFPFTRKLVERTKLGAQIKFRLDAAHVGLMAQEFFNIKLMAMVLLGVASYFILGRLNPPILLGAVAVGYIIPDLWLRKKIAERKNTIAKLLPETVDLLGLCVEAGLDFTTAVKWVIDKLPTNPMIEELSFVLEEIKWGKPRVQALKDMSKRLNVPEVSSFVQTMVQAERMGTPVAEAFTILSEDTRLQRFHRGERFAMQAPIKILIPLIFCILPVIAIIIGAPIFLQFMQGGMLKGFGG